MRRRVRPWPCLGELALTMLVVIAAPSLAVAQDDSDAAESDAAESDAAESDAAESDAAESDAEDADEAADSDDADEAGDVDGPADADEPGDPDSATGADPDSEPLRTPDAAPETAPDTDGDDASSTDPEAQPEATEGDGTARLKDASERVDRGLDGILEVTCTGASEGLRFTIEAAGLGTVHEGRCPGEAVTLDPAFYQVTLRDADGDPLTQRRIELELGATAQLELEAPSARDWVELRVFGGGAFTSNVGVVPAFRAEAAVLLARDSTFELAPAVRVALGDGDPAVMGSLIARVGTRWEIWDILIGGFLGYGALAGSGEELDSATESAFRAGITVAGGLILADLFTIRAGIDFHLTTPSTTEGVLGVGVRF